ncbi:MAG: prepilin-type N-terminal cleavage/methylation domain-containing protein [Lachnospiraceae bacterium]|nr:prepilin-type N-terminal cleavage/methylation domain-containing protein [Lachnospiraceae bacterium]
MQRKEDDGFTLIELIISMGVFSIVALALVMFMQTGVNSYQRAHNELNLQMESQMLINQIRDMTYSANYAEYEPGASASDPSYLRLYQIKEDYTHTPAPSGATTAPTSTPNPAASPGATAAPASVPKQAVSCEVICYDPGSKKIYYDKNTATGAADVTVPTVNLSDSDWCAQHLFCSYVESFEVGTDPTTGKIPNNTINLDIKMRAQKQKYELREGITVRNKWVEYP